MIVSFAKCFENSTFDQILNEITFENLMMYQRATPMYDDKKAEEEWWDDRLDANNPDNFKSGADTEEVFIR